MASLFRKLVGNGTWKRKCTSGQCRGFKQANVAIVHRDLADDFAEFCRLNPGPLPLLYRSKPGETNSRIAEISDIRTDIPQYVVFGPNGNREYVDNVSGYDWKDMVTFYIGCSFSFEDVLMSYNIPVRNIEQKKNVSMFKSNIKCHSVGPFSCNLVVSMRPIPREKLTLVADITSQMSDVHGGPVHIGNPVAIGIGDISNSNYGDGGTKFLEGDVPVFWCCGVTSTEAVMSSAAPLSITHYPGMMFVTDLVQEPYDEHSSRKDDEKCLVIEYSTRGQKYSILSVATRDKLNALYSAVCEDPGNRGISQLTIPEDFVKASLALSHSKSVAITTGFPCRINHDPPDETDGLPGVMSLAGMLQALGKDVTLLVDERGIEMNKRIVEKEVKAGILCKEIPVICLKTEMKDAIVSEVIKYDVILATERSGRASDGKHYSMKGVDVSVGVDDIIDDFFIEADKHQDISSIGIGDGGNELGMGKVFDQVVKNIHHGEKIACIVKTEMLVTAGVSNWGCLGLAFALFALRSCQIHDRYCRRGLGLPTNAKQRFGSAIPTVEREEQNLMVVESEGIRDGIFPDQSMSVDSFKFYPKHADKINEMKQIISK